MGKFRTSSITPITLLTETKLEDSEREVNDEETDVREEGYEEACEDAADCMRFIKTQPTR